MNKIGLISIFVGFILIAAAVISVLNFQDDDTEPMITKEIPLADDTNATAESVSSLVDSLNDFSFSFYQQISGNEDGNIFFSPYSIFTALSMAYEGAGGNTADEMQNILNILQNDSVTEASFGRIYNLLNQNQDGYTISTANAFWANQDYTFLDSYLYLLMNYYMAEANELDFSQNVEAAETINNWIEENTNGKIKDMIQSSMLSELTKLVLTNAIYFKGLWQTQFDPDNTFETDFEISTDQTVQVDMMSIHESSFNYTETDDLQILELPYKGNDISMLIILPKENDITLAESALTAENLSYWRNSLLETEIDVKIPKFTFETEYTLNDLLIDMGMVDAFTPWVANFSKMDGTNDLFISKVLHKAFIEVNEEGTEAAAAPVIIIELTAILTDNFTADHPFVFLIQHKDTGAILFTGKVMDPSA
jgi:serpin B